MLFGDTGQSEAMPPILHEGCEAQILLANVAKGA